VKAICKSGTYDAALTGDECIRAAAYKIERLVMSSLLSWIENNKFDSQPNA